MNIDEAKDILSKAFPDGSVNLRDRPGNVGAYVVERSPSCETAEPREPEILGRNFDLRKAVQAACLPILEKARADHAAGERAKVERFKQFGLFLQEKFKDDFEAWLKIKGEAAH